MLKEHAPVVRFVRSAIACLLAVGLTAPAFAQLVSPAAAAAGMHRPLHDLLDLYVRDGLVYYRALKGDRGKLDRYIASLDVPAETYERWPATEQIAFWIDAYNAFVLATVVDRYPIRGQAPGYPANSIRQIPGAFDRLTHRAAGQSVTLDQIEQKILPAFGDPRVFLALGRGALGGGRLRSEAYTGSRLESQLKSAAAEVASRKELLQVDTVANQVTVTPIIGWHETQFVAGYASGNGDGAARFASRSPVERAILAFIEPYMLPIEREFLSKNQFRVSFATFDWRLNDLTGGRPD